MDTDPATNQSETSQHATPSSAPSQGSNNGLIMLLVGLGVLGLLALIGIVSYFIFFYISPADYKHAASQTQTVIDSYNKASEASQGYVDAVEDASTTDATVGEKETAYKTAYATYLDSVKKLGDEKALRNRKVSDAYEKFVTKNNAFIEDNASVEQTMPTLRKIAVNCSEQKIGQMDTGDLGQLVAAYDKAVDPCVDSMKALAEVKNTDAAKIGKKAVTYFDEMRAYIVNMEAAYKANDRTKFQTEYDAFMKKANSFDQDTDVTAIKKRQESLEPTDELNNLASVINAQQ